MGNISFYVEEDAMYANTQYLCGHYAAGRLDPLANIALCPMCYVKSEHNEMWEAHLKRKYRPWWKFWA